MLLTGALLRCVHIAKLHIALKRSENAVENPMRVCIVSIVEVLTSDSNLKPLQHNNDSFFVGVMLNAPIVAEKEQDQFLGPQVILEWRIGPLALG